MMWSCCGKGLAIGEMIIPIEIRGSLRGQGFCDDVQMLRSKVRIASQHLPVLMASDESDLWNFEASFEQTARSFMP